MKVTRFLLFLPSVWSLCSQLFILFVQETRKSRSHRIAVGIGISML